MTSDAPAEGRHRLDPGALTSIVVSTTATTVAPGASLQVTVPTGWTVLQPSAGEASIASGEVRWALGDLAAGERADRRMVLRAPVLGPATDMVIDSAITARLAAANGTTDESVLRLRVAPEVVIQHATYATVHPVSHVPTYLGVDTPLKNLATFDTLRIRFQVRNPDSLPVSLAPSLQYRPAESAVWLDLPVGGPELGLPLYLGDEWRPAGRGRPGTVPGPELEAIPTGDFRARDTDMPPQQAAAGLRFMGSEKGPRVTLAGDTYTEFEFTVHATVDLPFGRSFEFRLTDGGRPHAGAIVARLTTAAKSPVVLSPGQRHGIDVGAPVDAATIAASTSAALRDDVDYALLPPDRIITASTGVATDLPRYQLAYVRPETPDETAAPAAPFDSPHVPDESLVADTCARCHSAHSGQGRMLLPDPNPQSTLCLSCHDGANGSSIDVAGQYADPSVPQNDPATRSYYRHDAMLLSDHVLASENEFGGVSRRHSECADCHNPHNSVATDSVQTTTGWTVSGRQLALSGVAVANGPGGTAPTYTFLDGLAAQPSREYEICLKCHSGFTVLPSNTGQPPSRWALDKGIDSNQYNRSFHPVEAAGTNQTSAMANSLAGTSPYKQWDFLTTGTVRCLHCHGDPAKFDATTPPDPGSALAPHASQFRGLLLQAYRDRTLKPAIEAYRADDFALCFVCHAEEPFRNEGSTATNFELHAFHVSELLGMGSGGLDIDTPGAGQGNAICAECHFRLHSTAQAVNAGDRNNSRLVNFAPNVLPNSGALEWRRSGGIGTCTLTCHGESHLDERYVTP
ncbi:MAG TPA: cytochrome c3 family protein [Candidatus Limnocylindrales bacterium]|nr:cytochrome c3 family protein [Candidatus Limnocylindrales bacterium]